MSWKEGLKRKRRGDKNGYHELTKEQKEKLSEENLIEFLTDLINISLHIDVKKYIDEVRDICLELGYSLEGYNDLFLKAYFHSNLTNNEITKAIQINADFNEELLNYAKKKKII